MFSFPGRGAQVHALWAELDAQGHQAIMTRSIAASAGASQEQLTNAASGGACLESTTPLHPPTITAFPTARLTGRQELTNSFNLQIVHIDCAPATQITSAKVVLVNIGHETIKGPLALYAVGLHSDYGTPRALNASGSTGGRPYWDLSPVIPAEGLRPEASAQPFELRFKISRFQPESAPEQGDAVAMWVGVSNLRKRRAPCDRIESPRFVGTAPFNLNEFRYAQGSRPLARAVATRA